MRYNTTIHSHSAAFTWLAKSFQYLHFLIYFSELFFQFTGVMRRVSSSQQ